MVALFFSPLAGLLTMIGRAAFSKSASPYSRATTRKTARTIAGQIIYWKIQEIFWEGVTHPDGGKDEEENMIHEARGAGSAMRSLAIQMGIEPHLLPGEEAARSISLLRLPDHLDHKESGAITTLERLGPSRGIRPVVSGTTDYVEASCAEDDLERAALVREYLAWLSEPAPSAPLGTNPHTTKATEPATAMTFTEAKSDA